MKMPTRSISRRMRKEQEKEGIEVKMRIFWNTNENKLQKHEKHRRRKENG